MTRYSRSVIPGRPHGEDGGEKAAIDNMVFGSPGKKRGPKAANDEAEPDFLPPVEDDEADLLVGRSNSDRRKGEDRRKQGGERRAAARKPSEYAPLREQGGYRAADDSRRGPILLVGALMIVAVFGVVVWNAYREDGGAGEPTEVAELGESGPFKRPYIDTTETPAPSIAEEAEVLDALDGAPSNPVASSEVRPATPPPTAAAPAPAPVKRQPQPEAKPPAPLSPPASSPVRAATAVTQPGPVQLAPPTAKPPAAAPAPTPIVPAAPPVSAGAIPAFSAGGAWFAQIASTGSEAGAIEEWGRRAKAWPDLFSAAERSIQTADVNGQTRYRLRVGAFASKAEATAYCAEVKARGGNCLPAQR
jgi:hypothetical protein